jgi:hypothetical protein
MAVTTFTWPESLPQAFLRQGYQEQLPPNVVRDAFDTGPNGLRRRATMQPFGVTGRMVMTTEQWDALLTFIEVDLAHRLAAFGFPEQGADGTPQVWLVRMVGPPQRTNLREGYWMVSLSLEVLETVPPLAFAFVGTSLQTADLTTYTFSNNTLGTPTSDRLVVVALHRDGSSATQVNSCTIGGVSATVLNATGSASCALAWAVVPNGATGDIVVTFNNTSGRCFIGVWTITGYDSATPIDTAAVNAATATTHTVNLDLPEFGVGIVGVTLGGSFTNSWNVGTERYDTNPESLCTASAVDVEGGAGLAQNITTTHTSDVGAIVGAVWQ